MGLDLNRTVRAVQTCAARGLPGPVANNVPALIRRQPQLDPKFCLALERVPKLITLTPKVLLCLSSDNPVTPNADRNVLLGSDTLLKLTLLSLHIIFSLTLLESPSDLNTFC